MIAIQVAAWSCNFILGKVGLRYWAPLELASFRVVLAGLIMPPVYVVHRRLFRLRAARSVEMAVPDAADPAGARLHAETSGRLCNWDFLAWLSTRFASPWDSTTSPWAIRL